MSPDAAGPNPNDPQALNLYRYGFNNPLRYTDPDGVYERDVHFDLTQALAYAAGYSSSESMIIAGADKGSTRVGGQILGMVTVFWALELEETFISQRATEEPTCGTLSRA